MIDLFTAATPNGWKVSIAFEEMELPYNPIVLNLSERKQHEEWFYQMNPNGRIPVIVDHDVEDLTIFETGAIMLYLAEKSGKFMPSDFKRRHAAMQWLMFQMGGVGPMMGQANVFYRYFPEKIQPAIDRYQNECRRLFEVLDRRLADSEWLAKDYSIADIANWCWVRSYTWSGIEVSDLIHLKRWRDAIRVRPASQRGIAVPNRVGTVLADESATKDFSENAQRNVQT